MRAQAHVVPHATMPMVQIPCFVFITITFTLQNVIEEKAHDEDADLKIVKFARTPIMSTYLLAFVVGEFDYVEDRDKDDVLVRVYTPLGKSEQGKFALEVNLARKYCNFLGYISLQYTVKEKYFMVVNFHSAKNDENVVCAQPCVIRLANRRCHFLFRKRFAVLASK